MEQHRQYAADPLSTITDPVKAANPRYVKGLGEFYQKEVANMENEIKAVEGALKVLEKAVDAACKCWYKPWTWFD